MEQRDERTTQRINGELATIHRGKMPVLIWRLKDAPAEVESAAREDGFYGDEEAYLHWRATKTGDEFIVMIPENDYGDDIDIAFELGLNVTERMRMMDFSGQHNPDCKVLGHLHYGKSTYDGYVVPCLTERNSAPGEKREHS